MTNYSFLIFKQSDEVELGLGIHGEPGVKRMALKPVNELVEQIVDLILQKSPPVLATPPPTHLVLLINNLGGSTSMEMFIAAKHAVLYLGRCPSYLSYFFLSPLLLFCPSPL